MKLVLYVATSINGYIAKTNGDSEWVSDTDSKIFDQRTKEFGVIIVGRKSFEMYPDLYPVKDVINVVLSSKPKTSKNIIFTNSPPDQVLKMISQRGFDRALLIGGAKTIAYFAKDNLIDEIFFSVHPLLFSPGIPIIDQLSYFNKL